MTTAPDSPCLAEALAAERQLHAFARALADDEHAAADLVQHAWLRWVQHGVGAGTAGFLRRVIRNRATDERRAKAARTERERAAARDLEVPSAAEMAAREQIRRRLADAVTRLDEPYRTTIWLRYFEELPPREIARRMGVPAETVRTRVRRALERLRHELDEQHGSRAAWAALAGPLARPSALVTPLAALTGVLLVHKTTIAIAASMLALLTFWYIQGEPARGEDAAGLDSAAPPVMVAAADRGDHEREPDRSRVTHASAVTAPATTALAVRGAVLHASGEPAVGLDVWLWDRRPRQAWVPAAGSRLGGPAPELGEPDGTTDGDGRWSCERGKLPRGLTVRVTEGLLASFELSDGRTEHDVVLPPLAMLRVRVEGGAPEDRWRIRAYPGIAIDADDPNAGEWAASYAYPVQTRSGEAILFLQRMVAALSVSDEFALLAPTGQSYGLEAVGLGFALANAERLATAPAELTLRAERRLPRIDIVVVDGDGAPCREPGRAFCYTRAGAE